MRQASPQLGAVPVFVRLPQGRRELISCQPDSDKIDFGIGQLSVVSCQLSVVSCQLAVSSGQLAVSSGQLAVSSGQWAVGSWQWAVGSWGLLAVIAVIAGGAGGSFGRMAIARVRETGHSAGNCEPQPPLGVLRRHRARLERRGLTGGNAARSPQMSPRRGLNKSAQGNRPGLR